MMGKEFKKRYVTLDERVGDFLRMVAAALVTVGVPLACIVGLLALLGWAWRAC